jgi:hypothetical protein
MMKLHSPKGTTIKDPTKQFSLHGLTERHSGRESSRKARPCAGWISALLLIGALSFIVLGTQRSSAAPIPGAGSSKLISPQLGLYRSPLGFEISAGRSGWTHSEPPENNRFIATVYLANRAEPTLPKLGSNPTIETNKTNQNELTAALTVRVDQLSKDISKDMPIENYVQKWRREYVRYGFDVIGSKAFEQNKQKGYVIDLLNRDSGNQLRQVVFLKNKKAVILTCRESARKFKEALKGCNEIVRTFSWTNENEMNQTARP